MSDRYDYDYHRDTKAEQANNYLVLSDDVGVVLAVYSETNRVCAEDDYADRRAKGEAVRWHYVFSLTPICVGMTISIQRNGDGGVITCRVLDRPAEVR